jgi:hypothetical protein
MTIPILTTGWHQFRNFYHVTLNPLMSFTFFGNITFLIKIFNGSTPTNEYPRYHRLTTSITRDLTFQMTIPSKYPISSKLVIIFFFSCTYIFQYRFQFTIFNIILQILPTDLGNFFKVKNHHNLRLCGSASTVTVCKLLFKNDPDSNRTTVFIASGWTRFCQINRIRPAQHLEFKCDAIFAKNIVIVEKLSRLY